MHRFIQGHTNDLYIFHKIVTPFFSLSYWYMYMRLFHTYELLFMKLWNKTMYFEFFVNSNSWKKDK